MLSNNTIIQSSWKDKTVIVSGGLGFIGSHYVQELALLGANVICLYRSLGKKGLPDYQNRENVRYIQIDLLDYGKLEAACKYTSSRIDCFIHCAALDGNTEYKLKHAAQILDENSRLVSNVLNSCRVAGVEDVVLLSSAEVYSATAPSPISETDDYRSYFEYTGNGYVLSKTFAEMSADLHHNQYGMKIYTPRPTNVYGPRDNFSEGNNRVIPSMINKISRNETVEIWGTGGQTRSFIYVQDLVRATLEMVEKSVQGPMNIATGSQISILELANFISDEYGVKGAIKLDRSKPMGPLARQLNVAKMEGVIDFEPLTIHQGLKRTIDWYRSNSSAK